MRLTDVLALAAEHGATRHLEKRGMSPTLIMTALQAPGIGQRAAARYRQVANAVGHAGTLDPEDPVKLSADGSFFGGFIGKKPGDKVPKGITGGGLAANLGGQALAGALGTIGASLLKDMYAKARSAIGSIGSDSARKAILDQLKREDPVLAQADDNVLMGAFHTMARFAPTLSTDKNAVRSFLRQAVMSGAGPDYMSIKLLAESERAVSGKGKDQP